MLFNSLEFLLFLPAVLVIYLLLPWRVQNRFLLAASIFFYASWNWKFVFPLLFSTTVDYWVARRLEQSINEGKPQTDRRPFLIVSLVANLGLLGFFKYFNFFAENVQQAGMLVGIDVSLPTLEVILPVGISFYTFQALAYTIDVYRGQTHATHVYKRGLAGPFDRQKVGKTESETPKKGRGRNPGQSREETPRGATDAACRE